MDPPKTRQQRVRSTLAGARCGCSAAARSHALPGDRRRAARAPERRRVPRAADRAGQAPRLQADRHQHGRAGRRQRRSGACEPAPWPNPRSRFAARSRTRVAPACGCWSGQCPEDVELTPRNVKRANPASWIRVADLAAQQAAVPDLPFRRFHAGQWTEREGHWLPPGAWQACVGEPELTDGERIYVGVDVGGGGQEGDTAVVWISERLHVGCAVFSGEDGVLRARDQIEELAETLQHRRGQLRPVARLPDRAGATAARRPRVRVPADRRPDDPRQPGTAPGGGRATARAARRMRCWPATPATRSPVSHAEGGASTARHDPPVRTSTRSWRSRWRSTGRGNQPQGLEVVGWF